jgi:hypothetical protein
MSTAVTLHPSHILIYLVLVTFIGKFSVLLSSNTVNSYLRMLGNTKLEMSFDLLMQQNNITHKQET